MNFGNFGFSNNYEITAKADININTSGISSAFDTMGNISSTFGNNSKQNQTQEFEAQLGKMKADFNVQINTISQEITSEDNQRNETKQKLKKARDEMSDYKSKKEKFEIQVDELAQKIARLQKEEQEKINNQTQLESKIKDTEVRLNLNIQQDLAWDVQLKQQQESIVRLQKELETFTSEEQGNGSTTNALEIRLNQLNNELIQLKKKLNSDQKRIAEMDGEKASANEEMEKERSKVVSCIKEKDEFLVQIEIKTKMINEYLEKLNQLTLKLEETSKNGEEAKANIKFYEKRYTELVNLKDQLEFNLSLLSNENEAKGLKVKSLENIINLKDKKISELNELIQTHDAKIKDWKLTLEKASQEVGKINADIDAKMKLIQDFQKDNAKDDSKIEELTKMIVEQKETIRGWEAENRKDDLNIERLSRELDNRKQKIEELRNVIFDLKFLYQSAYTNTENLSIVDEEKVDRIVETVITVEKCKKYKEVLNFKDELIQKKKAEIDSLNEMLNMLVTGNMGLAVQLDDQKKAYKIQVAKRENETESLKKKHQEMISIVTKSTVEISNSMTAHSVVTMYKTDYTKKHDEMNSILNEMNEYLSKVIVG